MTKYLLFAFILTILGCGDGQSLTATDAPGPVRGEILAMIEIDTCVVIPNLSSGSNDSLCVSSSEVTITFDYIYAEGTHEILIPERNVAIRYREIKTGPTSWQFADKQTESVLDPIFSGCKLSISAGVVLGEGNESRWIFIEADRTIGCCDVYRMRMDGVPALSLDSDGFPVLNNGTEWSDSFVFAHTAASGYSINSGNATVTFKSIEEVPVLNASRP
jgi:hypothetical protein